MPITRRQFLGGAAAGVVGTAMGPGLARALATSVPSGAASLDDIEHFVILMQENRSFDEYFGRMSGVIGFDDPHAIPGVFRQRDPRVLKNPSGYVLPWRMDTTKTKAQTFGGLDHEWHSQHLMWNQGRMDGFMLGQSNDPIVMGYYNQADIPYHYSLADAFTVCDRYFCSVFGPTNPNRVMFMSGTIDPHALRGGPVIANTNTTPGALKWKTFPETLHEAGVDWYLYQEHDNYDDNMLPSFAGFADTHTDLYRRGNSFIPSTALLGAATAARIKSDVLADRLPQVSYIVGATETSEHPNASSGRGAQFIDQILDALTANPDVWAKTLFIVNYDENDGHFDHVLPPTPPPTELDEYFLNWPVGLGFRVPMMLISPFTRGPLVSSDVFDHTSVIKLLERRFNVRCPNLSDWRRETVGDLTSAINFAGAARVDVPPLPDANALAAAATAQHGLPDPALPSQQVMPTQYTLPVRGRPSGIVVASATRPAVVTTTTVAPSVTPPRAVLPRTGRGATPSLLAGAAAVTLAALARLRRPSP
ncbi:MAG: phospholipase [Actinomycetota bacterium]